MQQRDLRAALRNSRFEAPGGLLRLIHRVANPEHTFAAAGASQSFIATGKAPETLGSEPSSRAAVRTALDEGGGHAGNQGICRAERFPSRQPEQFAPALLVSVADRMMTVH